MSFRDLSKFGWERENGQAVLALPFAVRAAMQSPHIPRRAASTEHERRHNGKKARLAMEIFLAESSSAQSSFVFDRCGRTTGSQFFDFEYFEP